MGMGRRRPTSALAEVPSWPGNAKPGGRMPTIRVATPSIRRVRPRVWGSAPKWSRQSGSESTATAGAPGRSSASVKARPSRGET